MLYVVDKDTELILGKWDAWYKDCMKEAGELIERENLIVLKDEITIMGDMVIWVERA